MNKFFNTAQKIRLSKSLFTKTSPAYVQFYITARCNLSCEQCNIIYADADSQEMSIFQIRDMAKNMAEIGVCMVLLIGGEQTSSGLAAIAALKNIYISFQEGSLNLLSLLQIF